MNRLTINNTSNNYGPLDLNDVEIGYTNGREFITLKTREEYIGYYFITNDKRAYEGNDPKRRPLNQLLSAPISSFNEKTKRYFDITTDQFDRYLYPVYTYPRPTKEDYERGNILRSVVKKSNEDIIVEIDSVQSTRINSQNKLGINALQWNFYSLIWTISGPIDQVRIANARVIQQARKYMPGLFTYLNDLDEFHETKPILQTQGQVIKSGLYTEGGEFVLTNGEEYIGAYHIHPDKGPMVGSQHMEKPHAYLYPMGTNNSKY